MGEIISFPAEEHAHHAARGTEISSVPKKISKRERGRKYDGATKYHYEAEVFFIFKRE